MRLAFRAENGEAASLAVDTQERALREMLALEALRDIHHRATVVGALDGSERTHIELVIVGVMRRAAESATERAVHLFRVVRELGPEIHLLPRRDVRKAKGLSAFGTCRLLHGEVIHHGLLREVVVALDAAFTEQMAAGLDCGRMTRQATADEAGEDVILQPTLDELLCEAALKQVHVVAEVRQSLRKCW